MKYKAYYGFLESLKNFKKLSHKNHFLDHFRRFFNYAVSYALFFLANDWSHKIHNRVEFYEYSILDCQVINFQSFSYQFSIHEMPLFGEVVGPNSPQILPDSAKIFTTVSIQGNKNSALKIFEKLKFLQKREIPSVYTFGATLAPFFLLKKMAKLKVIIIILEEKFQPLGFPKIVKSRLLSAPLRIKNRITFCTF